MENIKAGKNEHGENVIVIDGETVKVTKQTVITRPKIAAISKAA